jgi:hypothetical protein
MMNSNLLLLNEYLQENKQRSQAVDKARITRIQKQAKDFDPLTDQEPNSDSNNANIPITTTVDGKKSLKCKRC